MGKTSHFNFQTYILTVNTNIYNVTDVHNSKSISTQVQTSLMHTSLTQQVDSFVIATLLFLQYMFRQNCTKCMDASFK